MGIYISNIEMPKELPNGTKQCLFLFIGCTGDIAQRTKGEYYEPLEAKAIEVKPHGRLIDENVIRQYAKDVVLVNGAKHRCIDATVLCEMPCVIEAESEEINGRTG